MGYTGSDFGRRFKQFGVGGGGFGGFGGGEEVLGFFGRDQTWGGTLFIIRGKRLNGLGFRVIVSSRYFDTPTA